MESARTRLAAVALTLAIIACAGSPRPIDVVEAIIAQIQDQIRSGRTTCRLVVQAYLERIETYDEATVNAITVVNLNALERADEIDEAIQAGEGLGPLFCAPLLVKDNFDTHDLPTTGGCDVHGRSLD